VQTQPHQSRGEAPTLSKLRWYPARSRNLAVAAVSPTFGRLFEGTDVACAGQTAPRSSPHHAGRKGSPKLVGTLTQTC
jgi:hypothetical protein